MVIKVNDPLSLYALVDYQDSYVEPLILAALKSRLPPDLCNLTFVQALLDVRRDAQLLQWRQYEALDFDLVLASPSHLVNSYVIRKALIRKHYLSTTVSNWLVKHPDSVLKAHVKPSVEFEIDYAEFLDDALVEAYELRESFARNEAMEVELRDWWILKPGMSDRGQGVRLFSSEHDLSAIFEGWEEENPDCEDEPELSSNDGAVPDQEGVPSDNGVITSQLRHFVAQPYIHPPLLFPQEAYCDRKFHIRTYVLAVGALRVYTYKSMLALFAGTAYSAPGTDPEPDLRAHLTNTCLQSGEREGSVHAFWSLPSSAPGLDEHWKHNVFRQICDVVGATFEAAARGMSMHFQPLPNAFEIFGLDFLVDAQGTAWLLEVNAFPDFKQTGDELSGIIQGLFEGVVDKAVKPQIGLDSGDSEGMVEVLSIDLGRR
ncbi:hypothetical protein LTR66_007142 [Elasticomyces elasticus]|nr:hypothetical protein LTR66_007142 [Elasticomyces elasticus]